MWKLIFNGEIATGFQRQAVIEDLAAMLDKTPTEVAHELFSGSAVLIKEVNDQQQAMKWRRDFAKAGALLIVEPAEDDGGGSPYIGTDPATTQIEEPTPTSVLARLTGVRRRNQAYMVLGMIALALAIAIAVISKITMTWLQ